ncbi:hypothetical protein [Longitalea arenae]|uniref:hypothetical protein n=1 Tax=Longitalea arenae TaxID=2812558 RepID=UPI0019684675|nr:hypothetical protein [Longitalea arenae]
MKANWLAFVRTVFSFATPVIFLTFLVPSCITARKVDRWVDKKYGDALTAPTRKNTEYITVSTTLPVAEQINSSTKKTSGRFLPLLVYWEWQTANTCTLNPKLPFNNFTNTALTYASSKGLKSKLNGRRVELVLTQIPNVFSIDDESHLVFVGLYAFGWDIISVVPAKSEMVVSYKIFQDNTELKQGVITIPDLDKAIHVKIFNSVKRKTWEYIDQYNENITAMSKKAVDSLITQL